MIRRIGAWVKNKKDSVAPKMDKDTKQVLVGIQLECREASRHISKNIQLTDKQLGDEKYIEKLLMEAGEILHRLHVLHMRYDADKNSKEALARRKSRKTQKSRLDAKEKLEQAVEDAKTVRDKIKEVQAKIRHIQKIDEKIHVVSFKIANYFSHMDRVLKQKVAMISKELRG